LKRWPAVANMRDVRNMSLRFWRVLLRRKWASRLAWLYARTYAAIRSREGNAGT